MFSNPFLALSLSSSYPLPYSSYGIPNIYPNTGFVDDLEGFAEGLEGYNERSINPAETETLYENQKMGPGSFLDPSPYHTSP